jgi:hypothetical protein
VPQSYRDNSGFQLGSWLRSFRNRKATLSFERIKTVEALPGWAWNAREFEFREGFDRLKEFVLKIDHSNVPQAYIDEAGFPLGRWVTKRRAAHRKGRLSPEKILALESLPGWKWEPRGEYFETGLDRLQEFVWRVGHVRVQQDYVDDTGFKLGNWVTNCRARRGGLDSDQIAKLEALPGWAWDTHVAAFETGMDRLRQFVVDSGHARVGDNFIDSIGFRLGGWVGRCRASYKKGNLSSDRIAALEAQPGWVWEAISNSFPVGLERLQTYVAKNGHAKVPANFTDETGFKLGAWASGRRRAFKKGKISCEEISALEATPGWVWDATVDGFAEGFQRLEYFVKSIARRSG